LRVPPKISFRRVPDPQYARLIEQRIHGARQVCGNTIARHQQTEIFGVLANLGVGAQRVDEDAELAACNRQAVLDARRPRVEHAPLPSRRSVPVTIHWSAGCPATWRTALPIGPRASILKANSVCRC